MRNVSDGASVPPFPLDLFPTLRTLRLIPTVLTPLPRLRHSYCPRLTNYIIQTTTKYIPGASPKILQSLEGTGDEEKKIENSGPAPTKRWWRRRGRAEESGVVVVVVGGEEGGGRDGERHVSSTHSNSIMSSSNSRVADGIGQQAQSSSDQGQLSSNAIPGAAVKIGVERPQQQSSSPSNPTLIRIWARSLVQFLVMAFFSAMVLIALLYNGYSASARGTSKPMTFLCGHTAWTGGAGQALSSSVSCGPDAAACAPLNTGSSYFGGICFPGCISDGSRYASKFVRGGNGSYAPDSNICAAAIHSGVITDAGGCFEMRYAGAKSQFKNEIANGVSSSYFGWFPTSIEFRPAPDAKFCQNTRWSIDLVAILGLFCMCVIWRCEAWWINWVITQWGFYYVGLALTLLSNGLFWQNVNDLMNHEFTMIPTAFLLFYFFGRPVGFCPDPKRFPLEAFFLFAVPFWAALHIDDVVRMGLDFSLSAGGTQSLDGSDLALMAVLGALVVIGSFFQMRILWRAGYVPACFFVGGWIAAYFVLLGLASPIGSLKFHFHHYFVGLCLVCLGRGQRWYSIVLQALGMSLFVEGLAHYDTDPMFDVQSVSGNGYITGGSGFSTTFERPIWTFAESYGKNGITLEWALPSDLVAGWTCSSTVAGKVPGMNAALLAGRRRRQLNEFTSDILVNSRKYVLTRNGIIVPTFFVTKAKFNGTFGDGTLGFTSSSSQNPPLAFNVALANSLETSSRFRMPLPLPSNTRYHNSNANLCDRLDGIYSKLGPANADPLWSGVGVWW